MSRLEDTILSNLLLNDTYIRATSPFLKAEYFQEKSDVVLLKLILDFFSTHNQLATKEIIGIELRNSKELSDAELTLAETKLKNYVDQNTNYDWLLESTESWVKKRALYNGIIESIQIIDGKSKLSEEAIPKLLSDALAINFDASVGHNYLTDAPERYDEYSKVEDRIPFDLKLLNKVTGGGLMRKCLTGIGAETAGGKSIFMAHVAANALKLGKNVLYISLEMSELKVSERIDANLLNVEVDSIKNLGKDIFLTKIDKIASKTQGKLFVKEYPPSSAHSGHFRGLLEELKTKQNFVPELIVIDYLGICASSRIKLGGSVNTNTYMKNVAEELRGLAVEYDVPVLTGFQLNRNGFSSSEISLTDTADSIAIQMTFDLALAIIHTEELGEMKQAILKILKNRYGGLSKFVVGLDKPKMKFYDVEDSAQTLAAPATSTVVTQSIPIENSNRYSGFKF